MSGSMPPLHQLNQQVAQFFRQGHYKQALSLATQACDLARSQVGEDHPDFAQSLHHLADLYRELGNYAEAETPYLQALKVRGASLGKDHPDYARGLNDLGRLYEVL